MPLDPEQPLTPFRTTFARPHPSLPLLPRILSPRRANQECKRALTLIFLALVFIIIFSHPSPSSTFTPTFTPSSPIFPARPNSRTPGSHVSSSSISPGSISGSSGYTFPRPAVGPPAPGADPNRYNLDVVGQQQPLERKSWVERVFHPNGRDVRRELEREREEFHRKVDMVRRLDPASPQGVRAE